MKEEKQDSFSNNKQMAEGLLWIVSFYFFDET